MRNKHIFLIASTLTCSAFMCATSLMANIAVASEEPEVTGTIQLIERGRILNPEAIEYAGDDSNLLSPAHNMSPEQQLDLEPTWQNPYYMPTANPSLQSVIKTHCTATNYKVISKVGGEIGGGYMYDCWAGNGFYYSPTAFSTYGGGVTAVCPGNNKGAIYIQGAWNNGDNWNWSTYRGPYPNNGGAYCFYFGNLMKYRAVMLN